MGIGRFDTLVIVLFGLDDFKIKFLIKFNGAFIIYLNVAKSTGTLFVESQEKLSFLYLGYIVMIQNLTEICYQNCHRF